MKYKKKKNNSLKFYFLTLFFIIYLFFLVATSNSTSSYVANNINTVKALESSLIISIPEKENIVRVNSIDELKKNMNKTIEFTGTITGYGADCVGCSGILGCYPNQDVRNGNIYYEDKIYGKIRILAADSSIPCGSIIEVSNYFNEDFIGIVLDRGSDIHGLTMDLLHESENDTINIGRQYNINFKIIRWGY